MLWNKVVKFETNMEGSLAHAESLRQFPLNKASRKTTLQRRGTRLVTNGQRMHYTKPLYRDTLDDWMMAYEFLAISLVYQRRVIMLLSCTLTIQPTQSEMFEYIKDGVDGNAEWRGGEALVLG